MRSIVVILCLIGITGRAQTPKPLQKTSTITLYLTGALHASFKAYVDGVFVEKLETHHQVSFRVVPGYHEVKLEFGKTTPIRALHLEPGQEVFLAANWERPSFGKFLIADVRVSDLHLTLDRVNSVLDLTSKEDVLAQNKLDVLFSTANPTGADPSTEGKQDSAIRSLSEAEVQDAVFQGMHDNHEASIGYSLNDTETNLLSGIAVNGGVSGYSITVYSAATWIEKQASEAHRLLKPYTSADVDPIMRQDLILILATPSTPGRLDGQGIAAGSSASHVVVANESKQNIVQPLREETAAVSVESALRSMEYGSVLATFLPSQLKEMQNKDGEFLIAVTGGYRKFFKVKKNTPLWTFIQHHG